MKKPLLNRNREKNKEVSITEKLTKHIRSSYVEKSVAIGMIEQIVSLMTENEKKTLRQRYERCQYYVDLMKVHNNNRKKVMDMMTRKFNIKPQNIRAVCNYCR